MIVYNVAHKFFSFHDGADAHRKDQGLPPKALNKIRIDDRHQLADFLNALFSAEVETPAGIDVPPGLESNPPQFVLNDWARRASYKTAK